MISKNEARQWIFRYLEKNQTNNISPRRAVLRLCAEFYKKTKVKTIAAALGDFYFFNIFSIIFRFYLRSFRIN